MKPYSRARPPRMNATGYPVNSRPAKLKNMNSGKKSITISMSSIKASTPVSPVRYLAIFRDFGLANQARSSRNLLKRPGSSAAGNVIFHFFA